MRGQAWLSLCAVVLTAGISGCSTQPGNYADLDETGFTPPKNTDDTNQAKTKIASNKRYNSTPRPVNRVRPQQTVRVPQQAAANDMPPLSVSELRLISDKIFKNEGGGNVDNLVHWNDGEDFASMGIGHFTWYPAGVPARFGNTFPELLEYLESNGVQLPGWLAQTRYQGAPWRTQAQLMQAKQTGQVRELQNLLNQTRLLQAAFIIDRTRRAMPRLVNTTVPDLRSRVAQNLNAVANTPGGWYVLVDYTNFKGEGLNRNGGYRGQNWGLLQVLEDMAPAPPGSPALHEFANAAYRVLERRVRNSPPARNEARWLAGWSNRINTYRYPGV